MVNTTVSQHNAASIVVVYQNPQQAMATLLPEARQTPAGRVMADNTMVAGTAVLRYGTMPDEANRDRLLQANAGFIERINPNADFLVIDGTNQHHDHPDDLARRLGINPNNLTVASGAEEGLWIQDPFQPKLDQDGNMALMEPVGNYRKDTEAAEAIADTTGISAVQGDYYFAGGDALLIQSGEQLHVFMGEESVQIYRNERLSLKALDFGKASSPEAYVREMDEREIVYAIAKQMEGMMQQGISPENMVFVGSNPAGTTYGQVLDAMPQERLNELSPEVLRVLNERRDLIIPNSNVHLETDEYHLDLCFHPVSDGNGKVRFLYSAPKDAEEAARREAQIANLRALGYDTFVELPAGFTENEAYINYTNAQVAWDRQGQQHVLIPTQADEAFEEVDEGDLTAMDQKALEAYRQVYPEGTQFHFAGGKTAEISSERSYGGLHCSMQILPIDLQPIEGNE